MYNKDRIEWWLNRSSSPEYQLAYDNVARRIEKMGGTLVDIGCGSGEMSKRLSPYYESIIATDTSQDMLKIAKSNLEDLGIRAKLINDDLFYSKLPREVSDMTLFVFPELISIGKDSPSNMILDRKLASKFNEVYGLSLNKDNPILFHLRADYYLSMVTKIGGSLAMVNYDVSEGGEIEKERISIEFGRLRINGLLLESSEFFEDENIWSDTENSDSSKRRFPRERRGYRVSVFKKVS